MYKIRLWEFLNYSNVFVDILEDHYVPLNLTDTRDVMRNLLLGLFYSFFDSNGDAINVFDMWLALHPDLHDEILAVWKKIDPYVKTLKKYRGTVTFHMTNDPAEFVSRWEAFWNQKFIEDFSEAQRVFLELNKKLAEMESSTEFRDEVRKVLEQDLRLVQPVPDRSPTETWSELILKLAFRELDTPNYFRYRNPPG
jgi:hypothetical protein